MYVIVGLGNPDKKYEHTRHNIGFDVIDALADKYNISVTDKKHKALCGSGVIEGMKVLLVKPQTYMNLSGESVAEVMNFNDRHTGLQPYQGRCWREAAGLGSC